MENMLILTKAKHSEGQKGKRGGANGYELDVRRKVGRKRCRIGQFKPYV